MPQSVRVPRSYQLGPLPQQIVAVKGQLYYSNQQCAYKLEPTPQSGRAVRTQVTTVTQFKASEAMRHNLTFSTPLNINVAPKRYRNSVFGEGAPNTESAVCKHSVAYAAKNARCTSKA